MKLLQTKVEVYRDYIFALENNLSTLPSGLPIRSYTIPNNLNLNKVEEKLM